MTTLLPKSCGRRGAANSDKPDAGGAAYLHAFMRHNRATPHEYNSPNCISASGYSKLLTGRFDLGKKPKPVLSAQTIVARQTELTVPGVSTPGQNERPML